MTPADKLPYPCVVFDLDGTLLDTGQAMMDAINTLVDELGRPAIAVDRIGNATHQGLSAMLHAALKATGPLPTPTMLQQLECLLRERYLATAASTVRCFAGARELLDLLSARGAWLAVCSNQDENSVRKLLAIFGLLGYFSEIVGGDTLPKRKPDPMPLHWLMNAAGCARGSMLMVGDSEVDAECAERSGITMVLMGHGYGGNTVNNPHLAVPDFSSLLQLLLPRSARRDLSKNSTVQS